MMSPFALCQCGHPNSNHDINTLDDPRPSCCVEGCGCHSERCPACGGTGEWYEDIYPECPTCDGLGSVIVP